MHIKTKIKEEFEFLCHNCTVKTTCSKEKDPGRIRTCSLLIRSQTPYPLGHEAITVQQPKLSLVTTITNDDGPTVS